MEKLIRFGKNIHCTNSLSFLIPNLTVTSKASTIQSNLSNLQILIEDTVNPSENHFLVKDFGYSLSINSLSNTQFSIDLNFKPIQLRLFRLKEATEYISHAYKGFLDIQSSPKLQKHELEVKINNTQKSKKSLHIFERLLRKTDGIEFKFSVKIASIFAAIEDYCWKTRELQMILQSGIDSKQNIHSFSFSLSITNTMIATFVKHGAVQLFQDQLFTSIEGDDFLKFNWKVNLKTARFINFTILDKIFLKKIIFKDKLIKLKVHSIDKSIIKDILQIEESDIVSEGLKVIRDESWFEWRFLQCPFKENILCFQLDNQYIIAQLFKGKHKNRMHILYSTENFLDETEIFKLTKSWAADRGISFLWHISNVQNIRNNIFSKISKKIMNFAYSTPDDELSKELENGIKNIQAADSDSGHLILF